MVPSKQVSYRYHNKRKSPINGLFTPFMKLCLLFKLCFGFDFSCYFIVISFLNRIILIRFCVLLIWYQSYCTQIVPTTNSGNMPVNSIPQLTHILPINYIFSFVASNNFFCHSDSSCSLSVN